MKDVAAEGLNGGRTTREDWLNLALDILVSDGVEKVKVLTLAKRLDVSRSSFYWFFKSRQDLLDRLLDRWRDTNTMALVERAGRPSQNIIQAVLNVFECWVDDRLFDPQLDFAVREWSRRSGPVRHIVDQADDARVEAIKQMFSRHGYAPDDAFVRARVLYFMQIGYYSLELRETMETRMDYLTDYLRSFTGVEATTGDLESFKKFVNRIHAVKAD